MSESSTSPGKSQKSLPSPFLTRRTRTYSATRTANDGPLLLGRIDSFCRERGHGFVTPIATTGDKIFLHISDVEDEYVPQKGDRVQYKLAPIPPHMTKFQAVQCKIVEGGKDKDHEKWAGDKK